MRGRPYCGFTDPTRNGPRFEENAMIHASTISAELPFVGPHEPGTAGYRAFLNVQHANALGTACVMMLDGSTPQKVADFVLSLGIVGAGVSRSIENAAYPGTFAEAVFNILAD